jgi:hypothetical protein
MFSSGVRLFCTLSKPKDNDEGFRFMNDKATQALIDALKQALADPGEQRLYRAGKLDGLFAGRVGVNAEAAIRALRDGLLEIVRTETKGKTQIEWVKATPRATEFLHEHESPVRALQDLLAILQTTRAGVPLWLEEMRQQLQTLSDKLSDEAQRWTHRLEALALQVENALSRVEAQEPRLPAGVSEDAPWAADALIYLDRRPATKNSHPCTLPELFAALREKHAELTVPSFHERLRRLSDRGIVQLLPFDGPESQLPEPEWALPDGTQVFYCIGR